MAALLYLSVDGAKDLGLVMAKERACIGPSPSVEVFQGTTSLGHIPIHNWDGKPVKVEGKQISLRGRSIIYVERLEHPVRYKDRDFKKVCIIGDF